MAIMRTNGYTFSCHDCLYLGPLRKRRGEALQDEIDHHRQVPEADCPCPRLDNVQHHRTACDAWRRHLAATAAANALPEGSP